MIRDDDDDDVTSDAIDALVSVIAVDMPLILLWLLVDDIELVDD